jgi:hypothetical protein
VATVPTFARLNQSSFRSALFDPSVRKQKIMVYGYGRYIDVQDLEAALGERGIALGPGELDQFVRSIGGQRLNATLLRRFIPALRSRPRYFLPEDRYRRIRQRDNLR